MQHLPQKYAGLHLAGANSKKTCMIILQKDQNNQFHIENLHAHLGPRKGMNSDDRIEKILSCGHFGKLVLDAPLSLPPCLRCLQDICPGVDYCEDTAVACLLKIDNENPRKHHCNPQTHRLWDFYKNHDVSDHSSRSSLVARARTLQKRLRIFKFDVQETSLPDALYQMNLNIPYRGHQNFEKGYEYRKKYVEHLSKDIQHIQDPIFYSSIEVFHALICAWMAIQPESQLVPRPEFFPPEESFPLLPKSRSDIGSQRF